MFMEIEFIRDYISNKFCSLISGHTLYLDEKNSADNLIDRKLSQAGYLSKTDDFIYKDRKYSGYKSTNGHIFGRATIRDYIIWEMPPLYHSYRGINLPDSIIKSIPHETQL